MSIEENIRNLISLVTRMEDTLGRIEQHLIGMETASPEPEIPTAAVLVPSIPAPSLEVPLILPPAPELSVVPAASTELLTPAPFNTIAGLIEYATAVYTQIGMEKGAKIQGILHDIGYADIKKVAPEHFGAFYAKIEELKRS